MQNQNKTITLITLGGIISLIGLGSIHQSNQAIQVPTVRDTYLNERAIATYKNPNERFLKLLGFGLVGIGGSIAVINAYKFLDNQEKLMIDQISPRHQTHQASQMSSNPENDSLTSIPATQSQNNVADIWGDNDNLNSDLDIWSTVNNESEFDHINNQWQEEEADLAHPALNPENWVNELAILFYGQQGGGKTSKEMWLVEKHLAKGDVVIILNSLAYPGQIKGVEVAGVGGNFGQIQSALKAINDEIQARKEFRGHYTGGVVYSPSCLPTLVVCLDELTSWAEIPEIEEEMARFAIALTQELRQLNIKVIMAGHGDTLTCLGGKAFAGKKAVIEQQVTRIRVSAIKDQNIEGGLRCSGKVAVNWINEFNNHSSQIISIHPLLPSDKCTEVGYFKQFGTNKEKREVIYNFTPYKPRKFSDYLKTENARRQELKNLDHA